MESRTTFDSLPHHLLQQWIITACSDLFQQTQINLRVIHNVQPHLGIWRQIGKH